MINQPLTRAFSNTARPIFSQAPATQANALALLVYENLARRLQNKNKMQKKKSLFFVLFYIGFVVEVDEENTQRAHIGRLEPQETI